MFFTRVLQLYKKHRGTPGLLRAGKHRALPFISVSLKKQALRWMLLEQENLELLSKPYLTQEEEHGSAKERKAENNFVKRKVQEAQANMLPHRTAKDIFTNLYNQRKWE